MDHSVEEIYKTYPRRIGKIEAIRAIDKALNRLIRGTDTGDRLKPEDAYLFLLSKTQMFAKSSAGTNGKFTPYPATWFNRGSYLDDESEWAEKNPPNGNNHDLNQKAVSRILEELYGPDDSESDGSVLKLSPK